MTTPAYLGALSVMIVLVETLLRTTTRKRDVFFNLCTWRGRRDALFQEGGPSPAQRRNLAVFEITMSTSEYIPLFTQLMFFVLFRVIPGRRGYETQSLLSLFGNVVVQIVIEAGVDFGVVRFGPQKPFDVAAVWIYNNNYENGRWLFLTQLLVLFHQTLLKILRQLHSSGLNLMEKESHF